MSNAVPATVDLTFSRSTGLAQDLRLLSPLAALDLGGYRFYAQLWNVSRSQRYLELLVPVTSSGDGELTLVMTQAVAQGGGFILDAISGGDADPVWEGEALSGGEADSSYGEGISGGSAFSGVLPSSGAWDLLMVEPSGQRRVLLRGSFGFTA